MQTEVENQAEKGNAKSETVSLNGTNVTVPKKVTGEELKEAAIEAGVPIQLDFILYKKDGANYEPVPDAKEITVHTGEQFRCVASDDVA